MERGGRPVSILNIFLEGGESIKATPRNKSLKTDFFFVGGLLPSSHPADYRSHWVKKTLAHAQPAADGLLCFHPERQNKVT